MQCPRPWEALVLEAPRLSRVQRSAFHSSSLPQDAGSSAEPSDQRQERLRERLSGQTDAAGRAAGGQGSLGSSSPCVRGAVRRVRLGGQGGGPRSGARLGCRPEDSGSGSGSGPVSRQQRERARGSGVLCCVLGQPPGSDPAARGDPSFLPAVMCEDPAPLPSSSSSCGRGSDARCSPLTCRSGRPPQAARGAPSSASLRFSPFGRGVRAKAGTRRSLREQVLQKRAQIAGSPGGQRRGADPVTPGSPAVPGPAGPRPAPPGVTTPRQCGSARSAPDPDRAAAWIAQPCRPDPSSSREASSVRTGPPGPSARQRLSLRPPMCRAGGQPAGASWPAGGRQQESRCSESPSPKSGTSWGVPGAVPQGDPPAASTSSRLGHPTGQPGQGATPGAGLFGGVAGGGPVAFLASRPSAPTPGTKWPPPPPPPAPPARPRAWEQPPCVRAKTLPEVAGLPGAVSVSGVHTAVPPSSSSSAAVGRSLPGQRGPPGRRSGSPSGRAAGGGGGGGGKPVSPCGGPGGPGAEEALALERRLTREVAQALHAFLSESQGRRGDSAVLDRRLSELWGDRGVRGGAQVQHQELRRSPEEKSVPGSSSQRASEPQIAIVPPITQPPAAGADEGGFLNADSGLPFRIRSVWSLQEEGKGAEAPPGKGDEPPASGGELAQGPAAGAEDVEGPERLRAMPGLHQDPGESPWGLRTFPESIPPGRCSEKPPPPEGDPRPEDIPAGPDPPDRRRVGVLAGVSSDPRGKRLEEDRPCGTGSDLGPSSLSTLPVNEWTLAKIQNLISLFDDCALLADSDSGAEGTSSPFWGRGDAELPDAGELGGRIDAVLRFWSAGVAVDQHTVIFSEVRSGGFERVTRSWGAAAGRPSGGMRLGGEHPPLACQIPAKEQREAGATGRDRGRRSSGASARVTGEQEEDAVAPPGCASPGDPLGLDAGGSEPREADAFFCELLGDGGRRESLRWISAAGGSGSAGQGEGPEDSCCLFRLIEVHTGSPLSPGCRCPSSTRAGGEPEERAGRFPERRTQTLGAVTEADAAREDWPVGTGGGSATARPHEPRASPVPPPPPRCALPERTPESAALSSGPGREDRRARPGIPRNVPPRPPLFGKSPGFSGDGDQAFGKGSEPGGKRGLPRRIPPAAEERERRIGDDPPAAAGTASAGGFRGGIGFEPGSAKRKRDIDDGDPRSEFPGLHPRLPCPAPVPEQAREEGGRSSRKKALPDTDLDVSERRRRKRRRRTGPASPVICGSISSTTANRLPGFARLNVDLSRKQGAPPGPELHACAEELNRARKAPAPEEHMVPERDRRLGVPRGSEGLEEIRRQDRVGGTGSPKAQRAWESGAGRGGPTGKTPPGLLSLERAGSWSGPAGQRDGAGDARRLAGGPSDSRSGGAPRRRESGGPAPQLPPGGRRPTPGPQGAPARSMFERGNPALAAEPRGGGLLQFKLWPGAGDLPGAAREAERGPAPNEGGPVLRAAGERAGALRTRPWKARGAWSQGSDGRAPAGIWPPAEPTPLLAPGTRTAADAVFQEYKKRFLQKELKSSEKPVPAQAERTGSVG